jgi:hypothetical protein
LGRTDQNKKHVHPSERQPAHGYGGDYICHAVQVLPLGEKADDIMIDAGYGPVLRMVFEFSENRPFISGNHTHKTNYRTGQRYKTTEATKQQERLSDEAFLACVQAGWQMPDYCRIEITGYNIDADGDNLAKPTCDALEKTCFYTDRRIKRYLIDSYRDKGPSRIEIAIQALDGKQRGYPKPSKRKEPRV